MYIPPKYSHHYNKKNRMASMPEEYLGKFTNGGEECDMLVGPCACGATHSQEEWPDEIQKEVFGFVKPSTRVRRKMI